MKYSLSILWTSSLLLITNAVPIPKSSEDGPAIQDSSIEVGLIGENEDSKLLSNADSEESIAEESLNDDNSKDNIDETLDINEEKALDENESNEKLEEDKTNENDGEDKVEDTPKENIIESIANDDDSVGGESEPSVNNDQPADDKVIQNYSENRKEESDDDLVDDNFDFESNAEDNKNDDDDDDNHESDIKIESEDELKVDNKDESDDELKSDDDNLNDNSISVEDKETYNSGESDEDGEYVTEIVEFTEIVGGDIVEGNSAEINVIKEGNIAYDHIGGDALASGKKLINYEASSADIDADENSKLVGTEVIIEETKLDDKERKKSKSGDGNSSKHRNGIIVKSEHYSAEINSNEDSSKHKDKISNKSGHHSTSSHKKKNSSKQKGELNTKSKHHSSSTHSKEDSNEKSYTKYTKSGHSASMHSDEDSNESTDKTYNNSGHHSSSKSNEDSSETKNNNSKESNDKYKTMKDSYQYSITKDFEFEGSSEPKALRQSLLIKTGGFPYQELPNYIRQDLVNRMPLQTDLQQVHTPFGVRERPSIDSINNALEQILTVKSGSLPKPGAWCCPNSMALKGFACHNGDNMIPAEYFSHLTYFKFKDLLCQTGQPPGEALGFMSGPMHQLMPMPNYMNGDASASTQGGAPGLLHQMMPMLEYMNSDASAFTQEVAPGSLVAAASGAVVDSPSTVPLQIQGRNYGQTNQGLPIDIRPWLIKDDINSRILAKDRLFGSTGIFPGSESPLAIEKNHSSIGLTSDAKDSVYNNFAPDLEIQKKIFEDEVIPWPGESTNNFNKGIGMMGSRNKIPIAGKFKNQYEHNPPNFSSISQAGAIPSENNLLSNSNSDGMSKMFINELLSQGILPSAYGDNKSELKSTGTSLLVNNFPKKYESSSNIQSINMIPEEKLSLNWPISDKKFAERLYPKSGEKDSFNSQQASEIEDELLNWGFPKSKSHFVGRLPPKDDKENTLIHQQSNPIQEKLSSWGFLRSGNQFAGKLTPKDVKEASLIPQQSNPVQEEFSSWVFPTSENQFVGKLPSKEGKEDSLIHQQSNLEHDDLLSWRFPESDSHFANRFSSNYGNDKWVENNYDMQNIIDNETKDWIDEGLQPKDYAWVPNEYGLEYDMNQKPFDYTLQDKVLLKAPDGLHIDMLSHPDIGNDYLFQDQNHNILTKNVDFQNEAINQ